MKLRPLAFALLLCTSFAACGEDGGPTDIDGNLSLGEFRARVTGEISRNISGEALFLHQGTGGSELALFDLDGAGGNDNIIGIIRYEGDIFQPGDFDIGDFRGEDFPLDEYLGLFLTAGDVGGERTFVSTGGTLSIEEVSANEVRGSLTYNAVEEFENEFGELVTGDEQIRVEASFRARPCTQQECGSTNVIPSASRAKLKTPVIF